MKKPIPIITIEGPTAVGKSKFACVLAERLNSEIISADSRQVYNKLDIGTAKIDKASQQRVKHHLIDIIQPDETYNAGSFARDAFRISKAMFENKSTPIFCGGTGLYIKAALEGLFIHPPIPSQIREELNQRMQNEDLSSLYHELANYDPEFASSISKNDKQRIQRGLEIYLASGIPISKHWIKQKRVPRYLPYKIMINDSRDKLYEKINSRIYKMLDMGLLDEIQRLLDEGYNDTCPGLNSLGYKEFLPFFHKTMDLDECIQIACQHTRNYAKRQYT
ncbi:MAG: tRNA (adenosine(37)-N6)-dimethylallyltransferase MiaA, partial [Candidatus Cloacimonetes bacterium]|nr:tRNA (adenosine(37)-N6)-dimethylallyltransferase MiaA [Candidatus Cloacimonadota bacterium]